MVLIGGSGTAGAAAAPGTVTVDTITALRAATEAALGTDYIEVLGHTAIGDGGQGAFRLTGTGADPMDDDDGIVVVSTALEKWERVGYTPATEINVNWLGVFPDSTDHTDELKSILEFHPDAPLYFPQGAPNARYKFGLDVNESPDRAKQEANLGSRNAGQIANWEYCPKWRGDAPTGEPEESGTIIAVADASVTPYALRFTRRTADTGNFWQRGHFEAIRFWGETGDMSTGHIIVLDQTGYETTFTKCLFEFCECAVKSIGVFGILVDNCILGGVNSTSMDVCFWLVASSTGGGDYTDTYAGFWELRDCHTNCDKAVILSDNREHGNPAVGDRLIRNSVFDNQLGLVYLGLKTGWNGQPGTFDSNYTEAVNPTGATFDLSRYGLSATFATETDEAFRFIGDGVHYFDHVNNKITLALDPDATADLFGPTVHVKVDRYPGDHVVDSDSELIVENAIAEGTNGGIKNNASTRVYMIDNTIDKHAGARMVGHFTERDEQVPNYFTGHYDNTYFDFDGGTGTVTSLDKEASPAGMLVRQILLPSGGTETVAIHGEVGPGVNYNTGADATASWTAFTFAIRAVSAQPLTLTIKNSRRGNPFEHDISLEDDQWHSYCVVKQRGDSSYYYLFGNTDAGADKTFQIADIQAVAFANRTHLRQFLDNRKIATGRTVSGSAVTGHYCSETDSVIDAHRDFGLQADGTDETALVQTIVDAASNGGKAKIIWPKGDIGLDATINLTQMRGCTWEGAGFVGGKLVDSGDYHTTSNTGGTNFIWRGAVADTGTNLTVDASDNTVVTPDGYTPVDSDVNTFVRVSSGAGWTVSEYRILSHDGTSWTLDSSPAATSTAAGVWSLDYPEMFRCDGVRMNVVRGISFHSQLKNGTGQAVARLWNVTNFSSAGDGHLNFTDCSFALDDLVTAFECGVEAINNAADLNFSGCEFWGQNRGNDWADRKNHVLICNHLQNVNYRFDNGCEFAYIFRIAWMIQGGGVMIDNCGTFECVNAIKADATGVNNGLFAISNTRWDRGGHTPAIHQTLFDCTDSNAEPHICTIESCIFISNGPPLTDYPPALIMARNQCQVTIRGCDLRTVPIVRFHANDNASSKTALTSEVIVENCEIAAARAPNYVQSPLGSPTGALIQIDQTSPGMGYFKMKDCRFQQRPVDDFECGAQPGYWRNPDEDSTFPAWLLARHTVVGMWEMDEPKGATQIHNYASGGTPFAIPAQTGTGMTTDATDAKIVTPDGYTPISEDLGIRIEITGGSGWTIGTYEVSSVNVGGGTWTLDRAPAATSATAGEWRALVDICGHDGPVAHHTGVDLSVKNRAGTRGAIDTGVQLNISTTSYTFFGFFDRYAREPDTTQVAMMISDTSGDSRDDNDDYISFPSVNDGTNFDWFLTENHADPEDPINTIFTRAEGPGYLPLVLTWDHTADKFDAWVSGQKTDLGSTGTAQQGGASTIRLTTLESDVDDIFNGHTIEITGGTGIGQERTISDYDGTLKDATVSVAWTTQPDATSTYDISSPFPVRHFDQLASAANVYIGGLRENGSAFGDTTREWNGKMGRVGILSGKLTDPQIAELFARMTMTGKASYARPRTP